MMNHALKTLLALAMALGVSACGTGQKAVTEGPQSQNLTQGLVQLHLNVGTTTKAEVLEAFGSPNLTTRDGQGNEVWTYQRSAQVQKSKSHGHGFTILLASTGSNAHEFSSSSQMFTLIIKFDAKDTVVDFKSKTSTF